MFYKFHSDTWKEIIFDTVFPVMFLAVYRFYQSLTSTSTVHQPSRTGQPWCCQQGNHLMAPRLTLNNFRILQQPILPQMRFKSLVTRCSLHCIHRCSVRVLSKDKNANFLLLKIYLSSTDEDLISWSKAVCIEMNTDWRKRFGANFSYFHTWPHALCHT